MRRDEARCVAFSLSKADVAVGWLDIYTIEKAGKGGVCESIVSWVRLVAAVILELALTRDDGVVGSTPRPAKLTVSWVRLVTEVIHVLSQQLQNPLKGEA